MRKKPRLGDAINPSLDRNCLVCSRWVACRDPDKSGSFACSRFKQDQDADFDIEKLFAEATQPKQEDIEERIASADESTIEDIIEDVLNSGIPVTPDLRIDDRHIPRPNNFFDWVTKERFIGADQPPFAKQIQVCTLFLAELCPVCSDYDWFEDVPVDATMDQIKDNVYFLKRGVCPKCKYNRSEMIADGDLNDPLELIGVAGQRSGKSATAVLLESYIAQQWLLTPDLSKMFNILSSTPIVSSYTALTFGQARENLWEPLNSILTDSMWFKEYHSFLKRKSYELSEELFTHNDVSIRYRHKNLFMSPASPSKRTMRGRSRRSAWCDELGWFPVGKTKSNTDFERMDGKEVHTALRNSLKTISAAYRRRIREGYYNTPKPIMGNISSPSQKNDEIMKLYRTYQNSPSTHYCFLNATWDFNPLLTKEDFAVDFQTKPVEAARDYACEPPLGLNTWLHDQASVEGVFESYANGIKTFSSRLTSRSGKMLTAGHYKTVKQPRYQFSGILALDAGYTNNCLAGETKVITRRGTIPIALCNKKEYVLTEGSKWVEATFKEYDAQELWNVNLEFAGAKKTIRATANHRWFAHAHRGKDAVEVTTDKLKPGHLLASVLPPIVHESIPIDPKGVEHGAVFGDGTLTYLANSVWSRANLVAHKISYLMPYFNHYKSRGKYWYQRFYNNNHVVVIEKLPPKYKSLPSMRESLEYLLGFIVGYIGTDGCVSDTGIVMLNSMDKNALLRVRSICNLLGIATRTVRYQAGISKFNGKPYKSYKIFFLGHTMSERLLVNPEHKRRFKERVAKKTRNNIKTRWTIKSVEPTGIIEPTYCAEVPKTHSFVLDDYILTGNSFSFAIAYPTEIPDEPEDQMDDENPITKTSVKVHAVGEIIPRKDAPISFTAVYKRILLPICGQFNIAAVISDRWQNIKMLQDLEDATGAMYFEHRLSMVDFENYREAIFDKEIELPRAEMEDFDDIMNVDMDNYPYCFALKPVSHLLYQHMTVVTTGNTIMKGDAATDDIFRAVVLAYTGLQQPEILDEITAHEETVHREVMSASVSLNGGGGRGVSRGSSSSMGVVGSVGGGSAGSSQGRSSGGGLVGSKR